jgi:tetratricopeptide (TPR) repeat protein
MLQFGVQVLRANSSGSAFELDVSWLERHWALAASLVVLVSILALSVASRRWLRESQEPFRYTCSVEEFEVVPPLPHPSFEVGSYLRYDLIERMNDRIARLSFVDDDGGSAGDADVGSRIHISGQLLVRESSSGQWLVEATPRIRMGPASSPGRLGHPVKFKLGTVGGPASASGQAPPAVRTLTPKEYEKVLERIYFSIASELYKQIRQDVEAKIRLLPTARLRAIAYLHEAEDYLRSNTLDAYEEAQSLFQASLDLFSPEQRGADRPALIHWIRAARIRLSRLGHRVRQAGSRFLPQLGMGEILTARAEIGYAISLIDRRVLAGLSGHRMNAIFSARPAVERALHRLSKTSGRTNGSSLARFEAWVTKALAAHYLGCVAETEEALQNARAVDPARAETDARFLFAAGLSEVRPRWALPFLRRAVEYDPRLEIAQFELAMKTEYVWRMRPMLEGGVAESIVATEYEDVLRVNPGNIRAWANLGYVYWLLGSDRRAQAEEAYWRGREYKEIRKTTQVAELDHGLARLYAEAGDFNSAYFHYLRAVSGRLALGLDHASETSAQFYFFDFIGPSMLRRFDAFLETVQRHAADETRLDAQGVTERVRLAVVGFALNDSGEAYRDFFSRSGERDKLITARKRFEAARECNPYAVMPLFNLYLLESHEITRGTLDISSGGGPARARLAKLRDAHREVNQIVKAVSNLERGWPEAECARMLACARVVERVEREVLRLRAIDGTGAGRRWIVMQGGPAPALPESSDLKALENELIDWAQEAAKEIERDVSTLRRLAPHEWLWAGEDFNWDSLSGAPVKDGRWEQEVDDLHVRALFSWAAAQMVPGSRDLLDRRRRERKRIERLLVHIRETFWPRNFLLLRLCGYINDEVVGPSDLKDVIRSWLDEDPAAHWALDIVWNEKWRDEDLFSRDEKRRFLDQAKAAQDVLPSVRRWIEEREAELDGADLALEPEEPEPREVDVRNDRSSLYP